MRRFVLDDGSFLGVVLGIGLLIACCCVDGWVYLAAPGLVLLVPSLIHGMR